MNDHSDSPEQGPAIEPLPHQVGLGPVGKGISTAAGAAIGAAFPPVAVPVAGMVEALHTFGGRLQEVQDRQVSAVMVAAGTEAGISPEEVVRELLNRDDLVLLAAEAIDAARRSTLPGKAATLGQSLGAILADEALIDLERVWIRIVSVVEPPHIRILGLFLEQTGTMGSGSTLWGKGLSLKVSSIGEKLGLDHAVLPLIQDLIRAGLLMDPGARGIPGGTPDAYGQSLIATDLGAQLFARLSVAGLAESN